MSSVKAGRRALPCASSLQGGVVAAWGKGGGGVCCFQEHGYQETQAVAGAPPCVQMRCR